MRTLLVQPIKMDRMDNFANPDLELLGSAFLDIYIVPTSMYHVGNTAYLPPAPVKRVACPKLYNTVGWPSPQHPYV